MRFFFLLALLFLMSCKVQTRLLQKTAFEEHFNTNFDENWYAENHTFENNLAYFSPANVEIGQGLVKLKLHQQRHGEKQYSAAELRTKKQFLYGSFEARLKASDALGCISAFFLYRPNASHNTEIDFEISGKAPKMVTLNHWVDRRSNDIAIPLEFNSSANFHTYTINWTPHFITWEIDGQVVHKANQAIPNKAMQVIFNLWPSKSTQWAGSVKDAKLPTFVHVDSFKYTPYKNN